ncbi:MAG: hypothetical protein EAZ27_08410 [Cytophagales bacterium]|nr:MAG: hypothetical protein EAZ27_08410 [Cytophagales bacterium]
MLRGKFEKDLFKSVFLVFYIIKISKMNRLIILFCFLLFSKVLIGQVNSNQSDVFLFVKGNLLQNLVCKDLELDEIIDSKDKIEEETDLAYNIKVTILEKAIKFYEELIDNYPNSKLLLRTLNNKGFAELELNDKENAKLTFLKILNSNEDENEKCQIPWIIQKPYLDFKNKASKALANIYIKDSNYTEAIKYLDLAMKYPFNHFCSFENNAEQNYIRYLYAKCKFGIDKKSALKEFLPKLFQVDIEDNSELYLLIYNTLL